MMLSNNLLYLLLLYAVLDKENRITTTTGLLIALGIILYGTCRTAINTCCNNNLVNNNCGFNNHGRNNCNNFSCNGSFATATNTPFQTINNLF